MRKFLLILIIFPFSVFAQHQERQVLLYNIGFGGFTSGVGSVINKPKTENWKKAFIKGFWKGGLGGLVNYAGKKTLYLINKEQSLAYAWPAKILHSVGYSMMENAAQHQQLFNSFNLEVGPVRLDLSIKEKPLLRARFLPATIYAAIAASNDGNFDLQTTLLTGDLAFAQHGFFIVRNGRDYLGVSYGRGFSYVDNYTNNKFQTIAHEFCHDFQYTEYQIFNSWLIKFGRKKAGRGTERIFDKYVYFDAPYIYPVYAIAKKITWPNYFKNFYEFEAERFSTNKKVIR